MTVCCVCGAAGRLTRHHVVPDCYRRPLHHDHDYHDLHDVLTVCRECHDRYERHAQKLRLRLCRRYGAAMDGEGFIRLGPAETAAIKAARALGLYGDRIPPARSAELRAAIADHLGGEPTAEDMERLSGMVWQPRPGPDYSSHGEMVVARVEDMQGFWRMWRRHFVEKMSPRFMPPDWNPDREVRWSPERCRRRRGPGCPCGAAPLACVGPRGYNESLGAGGGP